MWECGCLGVLVRGCVGVGVWVCGCVGVWVCVGVCAGKHPTKASYLGTANRIDTSLGVFAVLLG